MGLAIGACHDVGHLSYINDLYNRTRLNQSIEFLFQDRKESTKFKLCERKSLVQLICRKSYKSPLGKQKTEIVYCTKKPRKSVLFMLSKIHLVHSTLFVSKQYPFITQRIFQNSYNRPRSD